MRTYRSCPSLWLVAIILALALVGTSLAAAPDAWLSHDDPLGFTVRYPPTWAAEIIQDELISVHNSDNTMFVIVQPFFNLKPSVGGT